MTHPDPIRLILIDDDADDRGKLRQALTQAPGVSVQIEEFDSGEAGLARLRSAPADCVVLSSSLPDIDGFEVLERLAAAGLDLPIIMLTGPGDQPRAMQALAGGASDYLPKAKLDDAELLASKLRLLQRLHQASARALTAEAELARAIAGRDSVLAVVSHDLRGPLNNIELAMGLLSEQVPEQQRALAIASVHRAITRADRLIRDLLDVARLSGGALELDKDPISPAKIVETAIADVRPALEQHRLTIQVDVAADLGPILADRNRVVQILDNLLRNAIKYGARGGEIGVELRARPNAVEFSVRDQGPGLDHDAQTLVFDRFWRAKDRASSSSGLGLAIAKALVVGHDGEIGVESVPGQGARFYFTIPLAAPS